MNVQVERGGRPVTHTMIIAGGYPLRYHLEGWNNEENVTRGELSQQLGTECVETYSRTSVGSKGEMRLTLQASFMWLQFGGLEVRGKAKGWKTRTMPVCSHCGTR